MKLKVTVNGAVYDVDVEVEEEPRPTLGAVLVGSTSAYGVTPTAAKAPAGSSNALTATIAGTVVTVLVEDGQQVSSGDTLLVLEAMKMETEITAPRDGTIGHVAVSVGEAVQGGQVLIEWAE
ncbi:biotin/lipoyl-binding protein [Arsenicicoccus piscis]|uniref:Acetyl-CoA carboxylase biotin carboxyl carrier protein subunit n=1 Tax=Arsenicicoccus piscis TaxID=673954 RepID=A0ABQ6HRL0_9MICO|nr:biotin/lipoyl-containing protein [Arsenicicoccus piscis]MCH8626361.1 biotin/lipoyl-binding protein [Arsenicicoccus piscis]GMA20971.1 acetyl-CoA carboxylase biotin carboxyl carrier protein subunit [Arsenicicoccus piscis]